MRCIIQTIAVLGLSLAGVALAADQPFRLTSPDLPPGKTFADRHTANAFGCHGANESPVLKWQGQDTGQGVHHATVRPSGSSEVADQGSCHDSVGTLGGTGSERMYVTSVQTPSTPNAPPKAGIPFGRP
jgi:hypothetical protein